MFPYFPIDDLDKLFRQECHGIGQYSNRQGVGFPQGLDGNKIAGRVLKGHRFLGGWFNHANHG